MKPTAKGKGLEDGKDNKRNVPEELLALHGNEYKKISQKFHERAENYVTSQGGYFEE